MIGTGGQLAAEYTFSLRIKQALYNKNIKYCIAWIKNKL